MEKEKITALTHGRNFLKQGKYLLRSHIEKIQELPFFGSGNINVADVQTTSLMSFYYCSLLYFLILMLYREAKIKHRKI